MDAVKQTKKLVRKEHCIFGDPNCTTRYFDDGTVECVMYFPVPALGERVMKQTTADTRFIIRGSGAKDNEGLYIKQTLNTRGEWEDVPKSYPHQR